LKWKWRPQCCAEKFLLLFLSELSDWRRLHSSQWPRVGGVYLRVKSPRKYVNSVESISVQWELPAVHRFTSYKIWKLTDADKTLCKKELSSENFTLFFSDEIPVYVYIQFLFNINKIRTRCNSTRIFIYCKVTLHVSGVTAPIIRSTKNCNRSLRYRS